MRIQHPGTITYINGNTGDVVVKRPIQDIPPQFRFADTMDGRVPVVRVVATTNGDARSIVEYGPDDKVVRMTGQRR